MPPSLFRFLSAGSLILLSACLLLTPPLPAQCPAGGCSGGQCLGNQSQAWSLSPRIQERPPLQKAPAADRLDRSDPMGHELAVVRVVNRLGNIPYVGSGVAVEFRSKQIVLTAWHTFRRGTGRIEVVSRSGKVLEAGVFAGDREFDLVVLTCDEALSDYAVLRYGSVVPIGEEVRSCGYGPGGADKTHAIKSGDYGANAGKVLRYGTVNGGREADMIVLSGMARQGDSGGPIFDGDGKVCGILTATDGQEVIGTQIGRLGLLVGEKIKLPAKQKAEGGRGKAEEAPPPVPPAAGQAIAGEPKPYAPAVQGAGLQGFGLFSNRERGTTDAAELKKTFSTFAADVTAVKQNIQKMDAQITGLKATIGNIETNVTGARADIGDVKTQVGQLRAELSTQVGLVNKAQQNEGVQVFAGDTGLLSGLVVCAVLMVFLVVILVAIVVRGRTKIALQKHAAVVLAASSTDQEARDKSVAAPPKVREAVAEAIQTKNAGT
jgi:hypothetical protein